MAKIAYKCIEIAYIGDGSYIPNQIAKYKGGIIMVEVGLGIVLLMALVGGIAYSGIAHKRISGKWLVGIVALGLIGLALSKGLPIDLGEFKGLV